MQIKIITATVPRRRKMEQGEREVREGKQKQQTIAVQAKELIPPCETARHRLKGTVQTKWYLMYVSM